MILIIMIRRKHNCSFARLFDLKSSLFETEEDFKSKRLAKLQLCFLITSSLLITRASGFLNVEVSWREMTSCYLVSHDTEEIF